MPPSAAEDLQVAVIGYGLGGAVFHAPLVAATPGMRVAVVVTRNEGRAQAARARYGAQIVPDVEELWQRRDGIDLVVVASPNRHHVAHALGAIGAGLPVVVDKPFAPDVVQAESVLHAAAGAGVGLSVFQNRRWDGDFLTARSLVESGRLGAVSRFESRFERWRPVPKGGWRESGSAEDAGGLLFDLGAHLVDQALVLFGPATHVYAELDGRREGAETDDDAFVALTHASGVRSGLWMSAVASDIAPRLRVLGSTASYVKYGLDPQEAALAAGRRPDLEDGWGSEEPARWGVVGVPEDVEPVPTEPGAYQRYYAEVGAALRGEGAMPVDPRDSIEALRVIVAAQRSYREHCVVAL